MDIRKPVPVSVDIGRIERHIKPLLGTKQVRAVTQWDVRKFLKDIAAGRTRLNKKTEKLRGRSIVRGGARDSNPHRWPSRRYL